MRLRVAAAIVACLVTGCSMAPRTNAELASRAQQAVDRQIGQQAAFSEMETAVAKQISCGHFSTSKGERDFVYRNGQLIMDDDPAFDQAAIDCDAAAAGDNSSVQFDS